ncbi:hypothetical protein [Algoriphagus sp.]|uniref:hypothetical protein n=1 Tax=Algoriphagus sp. TaxID=1872435 RepID=UPI0032704EAD
MKSKITLVFSLVVLVTLSFAFTTFTPSPEYYEGKWSVLVKGTPNGDATIPMRFETKEGKTTGFITEEGASEETKMTSVNISGEVLNAAFTVSGYDVTMALKKVDDDHANGDLMGMFDVEGTRVK